MSLFPHNELRYYSFGLRVGVANLLRNGLHLGVKKTLGKITQPINNHSRFPEYYWFDTAIRNHLAAYPRDGHARILDVGSPKMLGLYLATKISAEVTLTDISELNVDEYRLMWRGLQPTVRGSALFSRQDARSLRFHDAEFDIVYSMSVIEHIEGEAGDSRAVHELLRVLKPGGLLILSVPFGSKYVEQKRTGFSGAVRKTGDNEAYFFQRIYDLSAFQKRILEHTKVLQQVSLTTVARKNAWISRSFCSLSENVRGGLGAMNPLLSALINRCSKGIDGSFAVNYGDFHQASDVYGDVILNGCKSSRQPT